MAYQITSFNDNFVSKQCYFVFNEENASLIKDNILINHWKISKILYDSSGGEIITSGGDIIYLSKEITIKKTSGEEATLEYEPIDFDIIISNVRTS